jgi:exopolysaccharide production protein ExoQ
MPPFVATIVYSIGILCLFWFTRDREFVGSKALVLPAISLFLMSSRSATQWLAILSTGHGRLMNQADMYAEGDPLDRAVMILLIVLAVTVLMHRGKLVPLLRANLPIVMFYLYAGISVFWSDFPDITIRRWSRAVGLLFITFIVLSERNRDAAMKRVFAWVGFILIPVSMLWIKYYPALGKVFRRVAWGVWNAEYIGVSTQKNELGAICLFFGIVFLSYFLTVYRDREHPHRKRFLRAYGAALAILVWVFLKTNSVTAEQSFLLAAFILVAARSRAVIRRRGMVHLLMLVLVCGPVAVLFLGVGSGLLTALGRNSTLTGRTEIWEKVIPLVPNALLGAGFESFWLGPRLRMMQEGLSFPLNEAHNGYIEIYISLGWVGVSLLLVLLIIGYRNIIACYRRDPEAGSLRLALFLAIVVSACTEATFRAVGGIGWVCFTLVTMVTPNDAWRPSTQAVSTTDEMEPGQPAN